jgi:hypothetical protein
MLATEANLERVVKGFDQQNFDEIQLLQGAYPYQVGLQQRLPGKSLIRTLPNAIGSLYVFYMVYGRNYTFTDYGSVEIEEVDVPPFVPPVIPPLGSSWFDDFESYPDDLIAKFWGAGAWASYVGVCETLITGFIDPFGVYDSVIPVPIDDSRLPRGAGSVETDPVSQIPWIATGRGPEECADLPSGVPYTTVSLATVATSIQTYAGSAPCTMGAVGSECVHDESGMWQAPPAFEGHPYDTVIGGTISASEGRLGRTAFTGFSWQRRKRSDGSEALVTFDISNLEIPRRSRLFLVGTKTLSDGVATNTTVTTCAAVEVFYGGQTEDIQTIIVNVGATFSQVANNTESLTIASGALQYTELRIYDYTQIYADFLLDQ